MLCESLNPLHLKHVPQYPSTPHGCLKVAQVELKRDSRVKALLDGTHFRHILNYLRDPVSFSLSPDLTEAQRAELTVEVQFYGLLDRMMPVVGPGGLLTSLSNALRTLVS